MSNGLPPMNLTERCRRAEMIAERLAAALTAEYRRRNWTTTAERYDECDGSAAALDAWHQHQADLDTLAQAQQEGR